MFSGDPFLVNIFWSKGLNTSSKKENNWLSTITYDYNKQEESPNSASSINHLIWPNLV